MTLNAMQFCYVPGGPFQMGSRKGDKEAYGDELGMDKPYDVKDGFWMARFPVTQAQFQEFVEDRQGYAKKEWWTPDGLNWRGKRAGPDDAPEPFNLANHPRVNVSWYEAVAFTRWLTARWRADKFLPDTWEVRLPSEAEWEKAARGGERVPPDAEKHVAQLADLKEALRPGGANGFAPNDTWRDNPAPGRRYPWGNEDADAERANYDATGVGTTSAVGCFPAGRSPYGCEELAGNVWEWCATKWQDSYAGYADDNDLKGKDSRVLRGGSYINGARYARGAARDGGVPDNRLGDLGFRVAVAAAPM
jgi:formylglycine-generating enzyme required for sulfatase activity